MKPRVNPRLSYFTVEDESLLAEVFPRFEDDVHAIAFKVSGTDDVFVTTADTREAMERHDVPFNVLAEEDGTRISLHHTPLSREELADHEDGVRALALAYRAIALACVGVNGAATLDLEDGGAAHYSYFTVPAGHTFLWRILRSRDEAIAFVEKQWGEDASAMEWAQTLPLASAEELASYH